jgi:hypothetical protein
METDFTRSERDVMEDEEEAWNIGSEYENCEGTEADTNNIRRKYRMQGDT